MPSLPARAATLIAPRGLPVVRSAMRAGLARAFGPPPFDADADPGDPGLYGPGSASWHVIGEPAAIAGGLRALLVQLCHPAAMAGVADHSDFRADPLARLHRTAAYVTATTFGSTREALAVIRAVRGAHRAVVGTTPAGTPYRAADPHLLAWVQIALTSSFLATHRAYAPGRLDRAQEDAFVAEQSRAAALLDERVDLRTLSRDAEALADLRAGRLVVPMLEEGSLPLDVEALDAALVRYRPELLLDERGREVRRFLLWPDIPPGIRAGYVPLLGAAAATLEPWQRRVLRLPANALGDRAARAGGTLLLAAVRSATGPSPSVAAARRRAAA